MLFFRILMSLSLFFLIGCEDFPRDPEKTLEKVSGKTLKVGYAEDPPHVVSGASGASGPQAALVEKFAEKLGSTVKWVKKSEQQLFEDLEQRELHLVIGGFSKQTPWKDRVGISRPFKSSSGSEYVFAVTNGENGFLVKLEEFLHEEIDLPYEGLSP